MKHRFSDYFDTLAHVRWKGHLVADRTGTGTRALPGESMSFYPKEQGFPLLVWREMKPLSIFGELLGFLRGYTTREQFNAAGTKVWDANAKADYWVNNPSNTDPGNDLGRIYGANWRGWRAYTLDGGFVVCRYIDQVQECLEALRLGPGSRRVLFHAWNPAELHEMALPPCHLLYQFHRYDDELSLTVYLRSSDLILGMPYNIASAAAMLQMFADMTGCVVGKLTMQVGDAHIYEDHLDGAGELLQRFRARPGLALPKLDIDWTGVKPETATLDEALAALTAESFVISDYSPLPAMKFKMSV